jgi:hypothetical protein
MSRDEFDKLEVGRRYHYLTCVSVKPIVLRCDCGREVRNRSLTHLNGGLKSCGCRYGMARTPRLRNEADFEEAARLHRVRVIGCITPDAKARHRRYEVACLDCGKVHELSHERLRSPRPTLGGCQACSAQATRRAMRARFEARVMSPA